MLSWNSHSAHTRQKSEPCGNPADIPEGNQLRTRCRLRARSFDSCKSSSNLRACERLNAFAPLVGSLHAPEFLPSHVEPLPPMAAGVAAQHGSAEILGGGSNVWRPKPMTHPGLLLPKESFFFQGLAQNELPVHALQILLWLSQQQEIVGTNQAIHPTRRFSPTPGSTPARVRFDGMHVNAAAPSLPLPQKKSKATSRMRFFSTARHDCINCMPGSHFSPNPSTMA